MSEMRREHMPNETRPEIVRLPQDVLDRARERDPLCTEASMRLADAIADFEPEEKFDVDPKAVIVGGYVRDLALGLSPKDADIEVYGVATQELAPLLERLYGKVNSVGQAFGILKVPLADGRELDVSVPRRESKVGKGHQGFLVQSDPALDVWEAARRRDFTINTLALDPLNGEIFNGFGGLEDIANRLLRVTDAERFQDDPLRVYRAIQFAARFGLTVEKKTMDLMREMVDRGDLAELSKERVTEEWKKLLLKSEKPSVGLELMRELGIVEKHLPELAACIDCPQEPEWHPEGDVWIHTLMVTDAAAKIIKREKNVLTTDEQMAVMFGAVVHDFGKPGTTKFENGRITSKNHEAEGEEPARVFFDRLALSGAVVDSAVHVTTSHLQPGMLFRQLEKGDLTERSYANATRKLLRKVAPTRAQVILAASESDFRGRTIPGVHHATYLPGERMREIVAKFALDHEAKTSLIQGRDVLGIARDIGKGGNPGPWVGKVIQHIERLRDDGKIDTFEEALTEAERFLKESVM